MDAASDSGELTSGGKKNVNLTVDATTQGTFQVPSNESKDGNISDHEYLGGKGRIAKRASGRTCSSQQRQRLYQRKKQKTIRVGQSTTPTSATSDTMDTADETTSSTSTNEPANYDSNKFPHYKILTMPGYGSLGIRAIQDADCGNEAPILVGCIQDNYEPETLPREFEELEFWVQIKGAIEDVMCDLRYPGPGHWVLSETLNEKDYEPLLEKYLKLTDADISAIDAIKTGFVNPGSNPAKSLASVVGREAVFFMLVICRDIVRNRFPEEHLSRILRVSNIGRGSSDYTGSCVIAYYDDWEDLSEESALDFLEGCRLPSDKRSRRGPKNVKEYTPDVQVCFQHQPVRDFCILSAKVKTESVGEKKSNDEIVQSWIQSLIGLKSLNTAYAVLLSPEKGIIFQIHVEEREGKKYKRLVTRKKIWKFTGDNLERNVFQTKAFIEFVSAITGIMLKHKDDVRL